MHDASEEEMTNRSASARGFFHATPDLISHFEMDTHPRGCTLAVAEAVGRQFAKATSLAMPLCHPVQITAIEFQVSFPASSRSEGNASIAVASTVRARSPVGVEMESIMAVMGYLAST